MRMYQKYTNDTMFKYYKDLDENLAWLTHKTEESKGNKGNFTPPSPTHIHTHPHTTNTHTQTHTYIYIHIHTE